jgi:hypothetical protein
MPGVDRVPVQGRQAYVETYVVRVHEPARCPDQIERPQADGRRSRRLARPEKHRTCAFELPKEPMPEPPAVIDPGRRDEIVFRTQRAIGTEAKAERTRVRQRFAEDRAKSHPKHSAPAGRPLRLTGRANPVLPDGYPVLGT